MFNLSPERSGYAQRVDPVERLSRLFKFFAVTQCRGRSRVYEVVSEAIAEGGDTLELLLAAPEHQQRASLLFASVNLLLAADAAGTESGARLVAYYAIHGGTRPVDDELPAAFAEFCAEHRDAVLGLVRERSTQTNEIRRCVALRLGLAQVQHVWPGKAALVEVGASAGLNLRFDHYRYRLNDLDLAPRYDSQISLSCEVLGQSGREARLFDPIPEVTTRLGIDRTPVDLTDADARAWLEAFIWPEDVEGLATLRRTIDLALATPEMAVRHGDATRDVAQSIADLPGSEPVVVFTATLLTYLSPDQSTAFVAQLDEAAKQRPVVWIFAEAPGLLARTAGLNIPVLSGPLAQRNSGFAVGTSFRGGDVDEVDRVHALADSYLHWIAPARSLDDEFPWIETM